MGDGEEPPRRKKRAVVDPRSDELGRIRGLIELCQDLRENGVRKISVGEVHLELDSLPKVLGAAVPKELQYQEPRTNREVAELEEDILFMSAGD